MSGSFQLLRHAELNPRHCWKEILFLSPKNQLINIFYFWVFGDITDNVWWRPSNICNKRSHLGSATTSFPGPLRPFLYKIIRKHCPETFGSPKTPQNPLQGKTLPKWGKEAENNWNPLPVVKAVFGQNLMRASMKLRRSKCNKRSHLGWRTSFPAVPSYTPHFFPFPSVLASLPMAFSERFSLILKHN